MLGVWMWPESIRVRGTAAVFEACERAGVTDVFFLTKGLAGTTAFLSSLTPAMEPGRDLLREAIEAAHGRGMRLHAWFTSASDERYKAEHPQSGLYHYVRGRDRGIVSISDAAYTRFMQEVLADVTRRYDLDGVHLDYIRYNHLIYGWSEADQARYAAQGVDIAHVRTLMDRTFCAEPPESEAIFDAFRSGDQDVIRLAQARRRDVVAFADALSSAVRAQKDGVCVSAALMPEGAYDDLAFSDLHYGQNYGDLSKLMDAFLPMAYSLSYNKGPEWVREVARGTSRHGVKTIVGLHAFDGGTGLTLRRDIDAIRDEPGVEGVCLFREGAVVWAFVDGRQATLVNPLSEPITTCRFSGNDEDAPVAMRVEPGTQRSFQMPFAADIVRAYSGEKELCVYTAGTNVTLQPGACRQGGEWA